MVCLSTSSLSRGLFRADQASTAKGIFAAYTGSLKKTRSFDMDTVCCTFVGGGWEPDKKKRVTACAVSSVYVGVAGCEPDKNKGKNLSDVPHLHRASSSE